MRCRIPVVRSGSSLSRLLNALQVWALLLFVLILVQVLLQLAFEKVKLSYLLISFEYKQCHYFGKECYCEGNVCDILPDRWIYKSSSSIVKSLQKSREPFPGTQTTVLRLIICCYFKASVFCHNNGKF